MCARVCVCVRLCVRACACACICLCVLRAAAAQIYATVYGYFTDVIQSATKKSTEFRYVTVQVVRIGRCPWGTLDYSGYQRYTAVPSSEYP